MYKSITHGGNTSCLMSESLCVCVFVKSLVIYKKGTVQSKVTQMNIYPGCSVAKGGNDV